MLHATRSEGEFNNYLTIVQTRWSAFPGIKSFQDYFWTECINGRFNKWQIWNTPCHGIASTNSCIGLFNKQINFVYTGYGLHRVIKFFGIVFDKIINQYSCQPKEFCYYRLLLLT